jgi:hypothetical protein
MKTKKQINTIKRNYTPFSIHACGKDIKSMNIRVPNEHRKNFELIFRIDKETNTINHIQTADNEFKKRFLEFQHHYSGDKSMTFFFDYFSSIQENEKFLVLPDNIDSNCVSDLLKCRELVYYVNQKDSISQSNNARK